MIYVGIDFGHGETTVSRVPGYNGAPVSQIALTNTNNAANKKIISALCKQNGNWSLVYNPSMYNSEELREGFKAMVKCSDGKSKCMSEKDQESMREFARLIFQTILDNDNELEYRSHDDKNFVLGIACPSNWVKVHPEAQTDYVDFFRKECGIPVDFCIKESDAAFFTKFYNQQYRPDDNVFVIDLGSSTIDFTTYANGKCNLNCCGGSNLGAHQIEEALVNAITHTGNNRENIQRVNNHRQQTGWEGNCLAGLLLYTRFTKEQYYNDQKPGTRAEYEDFSIGLPFGALASKWKGDMWEYCIKFIVNHDEYRNIVQPYMLSIREELQNAKIKLYQNGIHPNRVLLSGGACRMPFIQDYARDIFQVKVDIDPQPECVVSNGIALYAKAQAETEGNVIKLLSKIDYSELYKNADQEAIYDATQEFFPAVLNDIKENTKALTAREMFVEIANFFYNLNSANEKYTEILNRRIHEYVNSMIASHIHNTIKEVYNLDIDTSDINIKVEAQVMDYPVEFFTEGYAGEKIMTILKDATGPHIITSFDIDKPRTSYERSTIVQKCKENLCVRDPFNTGYKQEDLDLIAGEIKCQCLSEALRVLCDKQLFEATFKQ